MTTKMRGRFGTPMKIEKDGRGEGTTKLRVGDPTAMRPMFASPVAGKNMAKTRAMTGTTARPHDPSGNEPNFDELIGSTAVAAATLGRPAPTVLGAR